MQSEILESITEDLLSIPPLTLKIVTAHYAITVTTLTKYKTPKAHTLHKNQGTILLMFGTLAQVGAPRPKYALLTSSVCKS